MRSISLVQNVELDFKGSVFQNAVCLVDIDNDSHEELAVCNSDGCLCTFKGIDSPKPWTANKGLGAVVVVCGGRLQEDDYNVLCTISASGGLHLFDALKEESPVLGPNSRNGELRVFHKQKIAPNAKIALMQDLTCDGNTELVVGYTDRFVRIYKWEVKEYPKIQEPLYIRKESVEVKESHSEPRKATFPFSLSASRENKLTDSTPKISSAHATIPKFEEVDTAGAFVLYRQFSLLAQVGSIAICRTTNSLNQLLVSQPCGGYSILGTYGVGSMRKYSEEANTSSQNSENSQNESFPSFYPITTKPTRTTNAIDTQIIGGIKRENEISGVLGLCTHDGNFMMLDDARNCNSNPVRNTSEERWFTMSSVDLTNNGNEEVVLCSLSGMTYIIDKEHNILSYNFNENVSAFCAGNFGVSEQTSSPCLCYVTLTGKIFLYYNVWIDAMKVKCVHGALIEKLKQREDLHYILDMFKQSNGDIDHQKIQNLLKDIWSQS